MDMTMAGGLVLPALLAAATIGLWAFALLPEFLTALLFFAAATILRLAAPEVIFSGFSSSAFWLVLSGFVIGTAIRKVGLADRVAGLLAPRLVGSWPPSSPARSGSPTPSPSSCPPTWAASPC